MTDEDNLKTLKRILAGKRRDLRDRQRQARTQPEYYAAEARAAEAEVAFWTKVVTEAEAR